MLVIRQLVQSFLRFYYIQLYPFTAVYFNLSDSSIVPQVTSHCTKFVPLILLSFLCHARFIHLKMSASLTLPFFILTQRFTDAFVGIPASPHSTEFTVYLHFLTLFRISLSLHAISLLFWCGRLIQLQIGASLASSFFKTNTWTIFTHTRDPSIFLRLDIRQNSFTSHLRTPLNSKFTLPRNSLTSISDGVWYSGTVLVSP